MSIFWVIFTILVVCGYSWSGIKFFCNTLDFGSFDDTYIYNDLKFFNFAGLAFVCGPIAWLLWIVLNVMAICDYATYDLSKKAVAFIKKEKTK